MRGTTRIAGVLAALGWAASATAAPPTINVPAYYLVPGTPGQQIYIPVTGDTAVTDFNLVAEIGGGGPEIGLYGYPAGVSGPVITGTDITGTIWASKSVTIMSITAIPQFVEWGISLNDYGDHVLANGSLVKLTIDTRSYTSGFWTFKLAQTVTGASTNFGDTPATITNGGIFIAQPGDANLDGKVDGSDLAIMATNWLGAGNWLLANFNGDVVIDGSDLAIMATNWGYGTGGPPVPEPASLSLIALGWTILLRRRIGGR